jgi:arsenate reductase
MTAHWGIEDPAGIEGEGRHAAFTTAFLRMRHRISLFLSLPIDSIDRMSLHNRLEDIGRTRDQAIA